MPTLIGLTLSIGTVQAFADSGWDYDEDSDSIIFSYDGNPVSHSASLAEDGAVHQSGAWYYSEGRDSIVYNVDGSRSHYIQTRPSTGAVAFDSTLAFLDQ
jgi:hypothetical protein